MQEEHSCALHFSSLRSIHLWSFKLIPQILFEICSGQKCRTEGRTEGQTDGRTDGRTKTISISPAAFHNNPITGLLTLIPFIAIQCIKFDIIIFLNLSEEFHDIDWKKLNQSNWWWCKWNTIPNKILQWEQTNDFRT
jgi:hypothetical protein